MKGYKTIVLPSILLTTEQDTGDKPLSTNSKSQNEKIFNKPNGPLFPQEETRFCSDVIRFYSWRIGRLKVSDMLLICGLIKKVSL